MADDAAWDTSKENFQPLRKGRDAKILTEVSAMPQGERATKIKEERRYAPAAAQISRFAKPTTNDRRVLAFPVKSPLGAKNFFSLRR
jgi:hypothetical protein